MFPRACQMERDNSNLVLPVSATCRQLQPLDSKSPVLYLPSARVQAAVHQAQPGLQVQLLFSW